MGNPFFEFLNKIHRFTGINKEIGFLTIGVAVGNGIFALLWLTLASIMPISEYGEINYLLAISTFGFNFSIFGLNNTMMTYVPKGVREIKNQINSLILVVSLSSSITIGIIFQSFSIFILIISITFFIMSTTESLAKKKYKEYAILIICSRILQVILILLFYNIGGIDFALIGYGIALIPFSIRYFSSLRFFKFEFNEVFSRIKFVLHSFSLELSKNMQLYDKLLIAPLFGFYLLGQYQLGIQFLLFIAMIPDVLFHYLLPQNSGGKLHNRLRYTGIIIMVIVVTIFIMMIPFIVTTFFPKFIESTIPIQIIVLGAIPLSISSVIAPKLLGSGQSKPIFFGVLLFVGVQTIAIVFLGSIYGTFGLAIGIVLALSIQAFYLVISELFYRSKMTHSSR